MTYLNDQHFNDFLPEGVMGGAMCTCEDCKLERFKKDRNEAMLSKNKIKSREYNQDSIWH